VTATSALALGWLQVSPPVVLAPMAGVTNAAFRRLCREQGAGLYVCEMVTSRGIVERDQTTTAVIAPYVDFSALDLVQVVVGASGPSSDQAGGARTRADD